MPLLSEKRAPLSWEPLHKGPLYCSPACGGGCTWTAFRRAKREAAALCKELGPGWEPRVYENLGWHWEVGFGAIRLHPAYGGGYGVVAREVSCDRSTPHEALHAALCANLDAMRPYQAAIQELKLALGAWRKK